MCECGKCLHPENRIVVVMVEEDFAELERVAYEVSCVEKLIDYFVACSKRNYAEEMLLKIIDGYRADLAKLIIHRDCLMHKLVEAYFPYEKGWHKERAKFNFDFERGEIIFTYAETVA